MLVLHIKSTFKGFSQSILKFNFVLGVDLVFVNCYTSLLSTPTIKVEYLNQFVD